MYLLLRAAGYQGKAEVGAGCALIPASQTSEGELRELPG